MNFNKKTNPRFVWLIGAIREQYKDLPESPDDGSLILWDRKSKALVATIAPAYANAICLEVVPDGAPFTALETWFNETPAKVLATEGID